MGKMDYHYSVKTIEWETPQDFFDALNQKFKFTLDVCANKRNTKCKKYYSKRDDGLSKKWRGTCWMNPPYGRQIGKWMQKAYESARDGATVVCLVPARTDARWWHDFAMKGKITFIRGRLKFGGSKWNAPFPNAVITFAGKSRFRKRNHDQPGER